jgi:peptidyl-prolyl cis-trans isomerase SurA
MTRKLWILIPASLLLAVIVMQAGTLIDRIVATVNGHIILQSDWDDAVSYEALIGGKPAEQLSAAERNSVLNRLIDQELLREQIRANDPQHAPTDEAIALRLQDIRKQYPGADTDTGWSEILTHYDLNEREVRHPIEMELAILQLVQDRLAPGIQADDKNIQDYYNQSFLPKLRESGAKEVPLAQVAPQIRELLVQQKVNEALAEWIQVLREGSTIRLHVNLSDTGSPTR